MELLGGHITTLLLRFFILYCPYLIEAGKVYKAMPPLYMVPRGKKKVYFLDNSVMAKENQKIFKKTYTIEDKNGKLSDRRVEDIIVRNADYVYELESAATNHGVTPKMLEIALMNYIKKGSSKDLEKAIKNEYRFVKITDMKGIQKIEVSDDQLYTIYNTDGLFHDCKRILKIMKSNDSLVYKINGKDMSMYGIMKIFDNIMPTGVQRYKGLGEQDADELAESTTAVETRSLVRYTVDDVKDEVERIRRIESDRKLILDYVDVVTRDSLIGV